MLCPQGHLVRKAYSYTRKDGKRIHVKAACIVDRGEKGRGPKVLPKPKRGTLGKYGYASVKKLSVAERRSALRQAVKAYGPNVVISKLTLVRNFNKNTDPRASAIFKRDAQWVHAEYF